MKLNYGRIALIVFLVLSVQFSSAALMTYEESVDYYDTLGDEYRERQDACIWECYGRSGITRDPDGTVHGIITINMAISCGYVCSEDPCTQPCRERRCGEGACTLEQINACIDECNRPKREACEAQCEPLEAYYRYEYQECNCICAMGMVIKDGKCVEYSAEQEECDNQCAANDPNAEGVLSGGECNCVCKRGFTSELGVCVVGASFSLDSIMDKFDRLGDIIEGAGDYIDDATFNARLKYFTGLDMDDFEPGMGEGKTAYIIRSQLLSARQSAAVGRKANLMVAFFEKLGYKVRYVHKENYETVFEAMVDPETGAVAYFSHSPKGGPTIEDFEHDDIELRLSEARKRWLMKYEGMSEAEARRQANSETRYANMQFFYNHTCYSAEGEFNLVADQLLDHGGEYYGEIDYLWSVETPDTTYTRE